MRICVLGLWHLGVVTAACLAEAGFDTVGVETDKSVINDLLEGRPPLHEPGLAELVGAGTASGKLTFDPDMAAISQANLIWVTYDTPVTEEDKAEVAYVLDRVEAVFPYLRDGATVLVSSQLPVGTTAIIEQRFAAGAAGRDVAFSYSPENLRLGAAIDAFKNPTRIIVGVREREDARAIAPVVAPFCDDVRWVGVESAEMTKHALNAYLATNVAFANEIGAICETVGADAREVEAGLRSDPRVGPKAYVKAGAPFAGGTLARDVSYLNEMASANGLSVPVLEAVLPSNRHHRGWAMRELSDRLGDVHGKRVAVLGLAYKPGTSTVRRSTAVELCRWLQSRGAVVVAYDPAVQELPNGLADIERADSLQATIDEADAAVVATEWQEIKDLSDQVIAARMRRPLVIDPGRFLIDALGSSETTEYVTIGIPS